MIIISQNSYKGIGKYNNDIYNVVENMYYVMDGASSLFNDNLFFETSDLFEYMQLLKKNIKNDDAIIINIKNGIIKSNEVISNINKYQEYELPTFTIASVKEYDNYIEIYLLCDCLISILYNDGNIQNIVDHRYDRIKYKCNKHIRKIDKMMISEKEKLNLKRVIWRKYRKLVNNKNIANPVGSTNPNSVENGITFKISKEEIDIF